LSAVSGNSERLIPAFAMTFIASSVTANPHLNLALILTWNKLRKNSAAGASVRELRAVHPLLAPGEGARISSDREESALGRKILQN
jgi:hypothetical protein